MIRSILKHTKSFEVAGELEYSRMPEMGVISCPLAFEL